MAEPLTSRDALPAAKAAVPVAALGVAWLSIAVIVSGFFMPWVDIEAGKVKKRARPSKATYKASSELDRGMEEIFGFMKKGVREAEKAIPLSGPISGIQIPRLANSRATKQVMQLAALFTHKQDDIGLKSYGVYALPALAILLGVSLTWCNGRWMWASLAIMLVALAVPAVGSWKLLSTKVAGIRFAYGLWVSLAAYVGLALASVGCAFPKQADACLRCVGPRDRADAAGSSTLSTD